MKKNLGGRPKKPIKRVLLTQCYVKADTLKVIKNMVNKRVSKGRAIDEIVSRSGLT